MILVYPSLMCADYLHLAKTLCALDVVADGYHIDFMEFDFAHNLIWGPAIINALRTGTQKPFYLHMMTYHPLRYLEKITLNPNDTISIHVESLQTLQLHDLLSYIKNSGYKTSIALQPATPLYELLPYLPTVDDVLLMAVEPGFSGQPLLPVTYERLKKLTRLRNDLKAHFTISIDGGVNEQNAPLLKQAGAHQLMVGSTVFSAHDPIEIIEKMHR